MADKLSDAHLLNAIQLYQSGMSLHDVAMRLGISATNVRGRLINAGIPIRSRSEIIAIKMARGEWSPPTNSPRHIQILSESAIADAVQAYQAGQAIEQIAARFGVGTATMSRYFRLRGIATRNKREQFLIRLHNGTWKKPSRPGKPIPADLVAMYLAGTTLRELESRFHICRKTLAAHLKQAGVKFDKRAMLVQREGEAGLRERMKIISARARETSPEILKAGKEQAARTRGDRVLFVGQHEVELFSELQSLGLNPAQQFPVGTYNLDIALNKPHIAIEIERGSWHGAKSVRRERLEHLIRTGWRVVIVRVGRFGCPIQFKTIAEKVAAFANLPGGHPATVGQYGVITREAKPATRIPGYFHDWARIPGF